MRAYFNNIDSENFSNSSLLVLVVEVVSAAPAEVSSKLLSVQPE